MPAFGPINENVFTTEGWILLGPPVHKLYGWLPLITVLLETCVWSGSTVACLAPEKAPMCFPWIVGNQQGFRLPGNSIMGLSSWGGGECKCTWTGCFLYLGQRKGKEVCAGDSGIKKSSQATYLEHRAYVQTQPWQIPAHITEWCHLSRLWLRSLLFCIIHKNHTCSIRCSL